MVEVDELPGETTNDTITLKWKEPESNGKVIIMYTVYQRVVTDGKVGQWREIKNTRDVSVRELKIALERGKVYQFAITATNELGESLKQEDENIQQVKAEGSMFKLSCSIITFHQMSCSLDISKFDMILNDSFCCLNERRIVNDNC